jgi:CysZ protein
MSGFKYFLKGFSLVFAPGIRAFVIVPVFINMLLFALLSWLLVVQLTSVASWLDTYLPQWLDWLLWLFWLIVAALWLLVYGYAFSTISNSLSAPFYGLLAEQVQRKLTGQTIDQPLTFSSFMILARRTLVRETQKLLYILPRLLLLALVSLPLYFIPVVSIAVPALWFLWGAWSLALQNMDYAADNNLVTFKAMRTAMGGQRRLCLSFGAGAVLASSVPVLNLFAVPAAVIGGTVLWLERLDKPSGADGAE